MAESVQNRRVTEKLMLARGYTWDTIQDTLKITVKQRNDDRVAIEKEKGTLLADEDVLKAYIWYKGISLQVIADLASVAEDSDSSASSVAALKSKENIAANIIKVAQELGLLPKAAERTEHQGTHNVVVRIEDKKTAIDLIAKYLGGENDGGNSDSP